MGKMEAEELIIINAMKSADHHHLEHHNYHRYHQYDHSAQGGGYADKGGTKRKSE